MRQRAKSLFLSSSQFHSLGNLSGRGAKHKFFCLALCLVACKAQAEKGDLRGSVPTPGSGLTFEQIGKGFKKPTDLVVAPDGKTLWVVEQPGNIRALVDGKPRTIAGLGKRSHRVGLGYTERGLLDVTVHPRDKSRVFLHYSGRKGGETIVSEVPFKDGALDLDQEKILFRADQPFPNHNGGPLEFGPDDRLYIGLGDGGSANDPKGYAQNMSSVLGKILRLDVSKPGEATVPTDNPFVGQKEHRPEIWLYGLRNPWKMSFDAAGTLYIGEVGQNEWESVQVVAPGKKGLNLGWNITEGIACLAADCKKTGIHLAAVAYPHDEGCSVTGGVVNAGTTLGPALSGAYFYGDWCTGLVRSFRYKDGKIADHLDWSEAARAAGIKRVSTFGVGPQGRILVADYGGTVYALTATK